MKNLLSQKRKPNKANLILSLFSALTLFGCAQNDSLQAVNNTHVGFYGSKNGAGELFSQQSVPRKVFAAQLDCQDLAQFAAPLNYRVDKPILSSAPSQAPLPIQVNPARNVLPLSPGDMLEVTMEYGEGFNGSYILDNLGLITLPIIQPINASGLSPRELSQQIELALIKAKVFRAATATVHVKVLHLAAIEVPVTGAVFQPGRVLINAKNANAEMDQRVVATGDYSTKRLLSEAIRAAYGVRPDAKLDQVILLRRGWQIEVDLSGILSGMPTKDYPLIAGDQVIVPSTGCFQSHLVRPSQITPKGFRVFMSNLIDSAASNSGAGVGRYSSNLPYGTKLLQAAVSANCIGGKEWTNAPRKVMLASINPLTNETQVIERSVEQLMRQANRDDINPYVMPNDAIACYDSGITNLRDVARTFVEILSPFKLL
ncbi:polysaccharide biosynthesis/export family protein [Paraglaciecola aquimarina]|uniref:Polysaccharide biosynthesis/export family protein n=1 Tax=Paraglaciecola algarum TaxID=3050085 RepID=A0ABS9DEI5_9ALTE|nr:polysaccharide biosynthesis/export family protein [Paraglaciecola sp. G1-23]MCF2950423.1 polysaccharide biosynthesis/export family protein [Paraglaciecola sp. G1-23]